MSAAPTVGRPQVQVTSSNELDHRRQLAQAVNRLYQGHLNASLYVTLEVDSATTAVVDSRISFQTAALFMPRSANAAADLPTLWVECTDGALLIHHLASTISDRSYLMVMLG